MDITIEEQLKQVRENIKSYSKLLDQLYYCEKILTFQYAVEKLNIKKETDDSK